MEPLAKCVTQIVRFVLGGTTRIAKIVEAAITLILITIQVLVWRIVRIISGKMTQITCIRSVVYVIPIVLDAMGLITMNVLYVRSGIISNRELTTAYSAIHGVRNVPQIAIMMSVPDATWVIILIF
jgi:hypothetical protein